MQNPHSYLITSFEAYLDHYRATGNRHTLTPCSAPGTLFTTIGSMWAEAWRSAKAMAVVKQPGLAEDAGHPPGSYFLTPRGHTGETCGSVFWIKFNQRFHQLFPEQEKYVAEIEKSLYNVCLANQLGDGRIRYHTVMQGKKELPSTYNSCCEGQGTRLFGSLPEYIYSIAVDGLYVNLFEPSTIAWKRDGQPVVLKMITKFPFQPQVSLQLVVKKPVKAAIHVRVPSWAAAEVPLMVNGRQVAVGKPGTYQAISRVWANSDTISFAVPMDFHVTPYTGADQIAGHHRYAIEYGPILLAVAGPLDGNSVVTILRRREDIKQWLKPKVGRPLAFAIEGDATPQYLPYWSIADQSFCIYPAIGLITIKK